MQCSLRNMWMYSRHTLNNESAKTTEKYVGNIFNDRGNMVNEDKADTENIKGLLQMVHSIVDVRNEFHEYNIFSVLNVSDKEVIMCRMLADLLNPRGQHEQGDIFLRSFLEEIVEIKGDVELDEYMSGVFVKKEYSIQHEDNPLDKADTVEDSKIDNGRIDIVIYNRNHFLPIEVKIKHEERKNQCWDYYQYIADTMLDKQPKIIYLTKDASKPDHYGKMGKNCICVSWGKEILAWLDGCLDIFHHDGKAQVKNMIKNYMDAISCFTDERGKEMREECKDIIMGDIDNIRACVKITKSFGLVQDDIIKKMFMAFEQEFKRRYGWEKDSQEPNDWKNIKKEFFGDLFNKYGSKKPCSCFKVRRSNSNEYVRLCICIDWRVWCEVLDNNGERVNRKWIYLPSGVNERPSPMQNENIPDFYSMNTYAINLSQEEFRK